MELSLEERESMDLHKEIVNTKNKINIVKEYGRKLRDQMKKEKIVVSDGFRTKNRILKKSTNSTKGGFLYKIVLQEDVDSLRDEIRELEAERDHLSAINEIDK